MAVLIQQGLNLSNTFMPNHERQYKVTMTKIVPFHCCKIHDLKGKEYLGKLSWAQV